MRFIKEKAVSITTSKLRSDIYNLLDKVLTTGTPLEVELKGRQLVILPGEKVKKLDKLMAHKCINGDPENLVHNDWSKEWNCDLS